jgi:hypothetical protein
MKKSDSLSSGSGIVFAHRDELIEVTQDHFTPLLLEIALQTPDLSHEGVVNVKSA